MRAAGGAIAKEIGISRSTAKNWHRGNKRYKDGKVVGFTPPLDRLEVRPISDRFLSQDERLIIGDLQREGMSIRKIAASLGRAPSTISREMSIIERNQGSAIGTLVERSTHPCLKNGTKVRPIQVAVGRGLPQPASQFLGRCVEKLLDRLPRGTDCAGMLMDRRQSLRIGPHCQRVLDTELAGEIVDHDRRAHQEDPAGTSQGSAPSPAAP